MSAADAKILAEVLVVERDRRGSSEGSCAECQNLDEPGRCRAVTEGMNVVPRPVSEVWACYLARRPHC
jgi:hypothetical protein